MDHADEPRAPAPRVDDRTDSATAPSPPSASSDPELPTKPPAPTPEPRPAEPALGLGGWPLTALVALICGLAGSYIQGRFFAPPAAVSATPVAGSSEEPAADAKFAVDATEARTTAPVLGTRDLTDRVGKLSQQLNALQKKVDAQSRSGPPPEVASLQVRVADLTDATNHLASLPSKVDHLTNRVTELSGSLATLDNEMASFQSRYGPTTRLAAGGSTPRSNRPPVDTPTTPSTTPTPLPDNRHRDTDKPTAALADAKSLSNGADLLRRGRYKEARDAFNALEIRYPDDARVWYYAALSLGFLTSDWTEGAVRLVEKGIAREAAGAPSASVIDSEFKDLTSATGKDWLAAYRKRVNATSP